MTSAPANYRSDNLKLPELQSMYTSPSAGLTPESRQQAIAAMAADARRSARANSPRVGTDGTRPGVSSVPRIDTSQVYAPHQQQQQQFLPDSTGAASVPLGVRDGSTANSSGYTPSPRPHHTLSPRRRSILEEKNAVLEAELRERNETLEHLEMENLERLKEVARIRRDQQRQRQEEVELLSKELQILVQENEAMRQQQEAEINRRVQIELAKRIAAAGGVAAISQQQQPTPAGAAAVGPTAPAKVQKPKVLKQVHDDQVQVQASEKETGEKSLGAELIFNTDPPVREKEREVGDGVDKKFTARRRGRAYLGCGPIGKGSATPLFEEGRGFRLESKDDSGNDEWSFYNDCNEYELHIRWRFSPRSSIKAVGSASATPDEDGWTVVTDVIYPSETRVFVRGDVNGWKASYSLKPLSQEYRAGLYAEAERRSREEFAKMKDLAARCPKGDLVALLRLCLEKRIPFVDTHFQPSQNSVCRPGVDPKFPTFPWQRPSQFLPLAEQANICLFDGIDPNDIDQGELGDCWFLCAIASVAEFPPLIRRIFAPNDSDGAPAIRQSGYVLRLNKNGWWQDVVVDSYFPANGIRPAFAATKETPGELWCSLLEKAYAKLHGSYAAIAGGYPLHGLIDLTGFAGWNITSRMEAARKNTKAADELFKDLERYDVLNYLVSVGTPGEDDSSYNIGHGSNSDSLKKKYEDIGLVLGHAYSVLKVKSFPKHNLRLLHIRNPWGNAKEWNGDWGDNDPKWNQFPAVRDACEFVKAEDGSFWMPFAKFLDYFEDGQVCCQGPWTVDCRAKGSFKRGVPSTIFKVTATSKVAAMLTLSQKDPRGLPKSDLDSKKAAMLLTVAVPSESSDQLENKICTSGDPFQPSKGKRTFRYDRDMSLLHTFQPSEDAYYIIPRIYDASLVKDYTLTIRVPPTAVKNGSVKISCVSFSANAAPFENYACFSEDECSPSPCKTACQVCFEKKLATEKTDNFASLLCETVGFNAAAAQPQQPAPPAAAPAVQSAVVQPTPQGQPAPTRPNQQHQPTTATATANQHADPLARISAFFGGGAPTPTPTPRAFVPSPSLAELCQRLTRYYSVYCPEKMGNVENITQRYFQLQEQLFAALKQKYGPEPEYTRPQEPEEEDSGWFFL